MNFGPYQQCGIRCFCLVLQSRRIKEICKFQTCARKIKFEAQPIYQSCRKKFRGPEMNQGSSLQNFSFPSLSSHSEPTLHKVSLKPHYKATRKDPDPKKIPRASFGLLNLCAKFLDNISTGSTLTRRVTRPPRFHVWACLLYSNTSWSFQRIMF
jgi:hypothetical protein